MNIIKYLSTGYLHELRGVNCEDYADFVTRKLDDGYEYTVMALSDGCSSSKYAFDSAKTNVQSVLDYFNRIPLRDLIDKLSSENSITIVKEEIKKEYMLKLVNLAKDIGSINLSDFCATLVFAVIDNENILIGHIGDGAAFCMDESGSTSFVSLPDNGSDTRHTHFTIENNVEDFYLSLYSASEIDSIMICSDGPKDFICQKGHTYKDSYTIKNIAQKINANEITNCLQLADTIIDESLGIIYHMDDWSILYYKKDQEQCDDCSMNPLSTAVEFVDKKGITSDVALLEIANSNRKQKDNIEQKNLINIVSKEDNDETDTELISDCDKKNETGLTEDDDSEILQLVNDKNKSTSVDMNDSDIILNQQENDLKTITKKNNFIKLTEYLFRF